MCVYIYKNQSKYEIEQADRDDLSPAVVTAKHLDFFKSEPVSKFKPATFDDGMLQKMDASLLKACFESFGISLKACNRLCHI